MNSLREEFRACLMQRLTTSYVRSNSPCGVRVHKPFCSAKQQLHAKAGELLDRLMALSPKRHSRSQLRTLQRRVRQWRIVVAKQLVYASAERSIRIHCQAGSA